MTTYPQPFNASHFYQYANWNLLQAKNSWATQKPLEKNLPCANHGGHSPVTQHSDILCSQDMLSAAQPSPLTC